VGSARRGKAISTHNRFSEAGCLDCNRRRHGTYALRTDGITISAKAQIRVRRGSPGSANLLTVRGSRSGNSERAEAARRQARMALGKDPDVQDYGGRPKPRSPLPLPPGPVWVAHGPGIGVLTVGEAAQRLGMSEPELEAMIARGQVKALPTEFIRVVPTSEVDRPMQPRK
jgi:hypothetical protein